MVRYSQHSKHLVVGGASMFKLWPIFLENSDITWLCLFILLSLVKSNSKFKSKMSSIFNSFLTNLISLSFSDLIKVGSFFIKVMNSNKTTSLVNFKPDSENKVTLAVFILRLLWQHDCTDCMSRSCLTWCSKPSLSILESSLLSCGYELRITTKWNLQPIAEKQWQWKISLLVAN